MLRQYHTQVWRTAYRMGLSSAQAEDAAQQAFIVASERIDEIKNGSERSFLLSVVIRVAKRMRHSAAERREALNAEELHSIADLRHTPERLVELKEARVLLERVLNTLPDKMREPFILFELEGLPLQEICELLGLPMGTLSSRLNRARERFEKGVQALRDAGDAK